MTKSKNYDILTKPKEGENKMKKEIMPKAIIEMGKGVMVTLLERQDYGIMVVDIKETDKKAGKEYIFQSTQEMDSFGKCWEIDTNNNVESKSTKDGIYSLKEELEDRGSLIKDPGYDFDENKPMICLSTKTATYWLGYVDSKDPEAIGIEVSNYQTGDIVTTTVNKEGIINQYYDCFETNNKAKPTNQTSLTKQKSYQQRKRSY